MVSGIHNSFLPGAALHSRHGRNGTDGISARIGAASVQRDISADLKIVTKEGDTVTISAKLDTSATYASLRQRGAGASSAQFQSTSSIDVQVQGDLSAQEQADIAQVVRRFMQDLRGLASGRDVSVANVATGDPQTLRSIEADAKTQTTITAVAAFGLKASMPGGPMPVAPATGTDGPSDSPARPAVAAD